MIKYGVEQSETVEYYARKARSGKMTYAEAVSALKKKGIIMTEMELKIKAGEI